MGLNPLNLIRVMPAKERESIDWPSPPSLSLAPASPASPARSSLPSAGWPSRWSSAASALGDGSCSWMAGGMLAPWCERATDRARGRDAGRAVDRLVGRALPRHGAKRQPGAWRQPRDAPDLDALRRAHRALRMGSMPSASPTLEPDLAGRFRRALFFPDEAHLDPRRALAVAGRDADEAAASPIRFGVDLAPADRRRRYRRRLPRPCRARRAARPARRARRDDRRALARRVAGAAGAHAPSAHAALHRAARRRACS